MDRSFILRSEAIRASASTFVASLPIAEKPWEVRIRPHKSRRTLDQNNYYWMRMAEIAAQTGNGTEEVHEFMKAEFLVPIVVDMLTKSRTVPGSTTKLSVEKMAEYITKCEAWAANNGIRLSDMRQA